MGFEPNAKTLEYKERLVAFMDELVYPREIEQSRLLLLEAADRMDKQGIADGPDDVHMSLLGKMTVKPFSNLTI